MLGTGQATVESVKLAVRHFIWHTSCANTQKMIVSEQESAIFSQEKVNMCVGYTQARRRGTGDVVEHRLVGNWDCFARPCTPDMTMSRPKGCDSRRTWRWSSNFDQISLNTGKANARNVSSAPIDKAMSALYTLYRSLWVVRKALCVIVWCPQIWRQRQRNKYFRSDSDSTDRKCIFRMPASESFWCTLMLEKPCWNKAPFETKDAALLATKIIFNPLIYTMSKSPWLIKTIAVFNTWIPRGTCRLGNRTYGVS